MPITSEELSRRLQDRLPLIRNLRKTAIELVKMSQNIRERKSIKSNTSDRNGG